MVTTFKELVKAYTGSLMATILIHAKYGETTSSIPVMVLLDKLEKHYAGKNARSAANYMAAFLKDYPKEVLPPRVKEICSNLTLLRTDHNAVGYPHTDGTYHWFGG